MIQLGIAAALSCLVFAEYMRRKTRSIEENILEKVESMLAEVDGGVCSECQNSRVTHRVTGTGGSRRVVDGSIKKKKKNHHTDDDDDAMLHRADDILDIGSEEDEQEDGWLIHVE
ncbi:hypothetical protein M9435_004035 [Picochlorum sp. BPE23]|nr:hypothetical protein M9435_004035 [Picochlorum sp. BPE23]